MSTLLSNTLINYSCSTKKTWIKKDSGLFDIAIDAFDGPEVCELVGNFPLHKLCEKYESKNLALHRDDGLAIFKNVSGPV